MMVEFQVNGIKYKRIKCEFLCYLVCPSPFGTSILEPCFYLSNEFEINKLSSRKKLDELSNFLFKSFEIDSGNRLVSGAEEINLIEFGFGGTDLNDCIQAQ